MSSTLCLRPLDKIALELTPCMNRLVKKSQSDEYKKIDEQLNRLQASDIKNYYDNNSRTQSIARRNSL